MTDAFDPPSCTPPELGLIIDELTAESLGLHSPHTVARVVVDSYMQLSRSARDLTYLPLLAARFARDRLLAAATIEGTLSVRQARGPVRLRAQRRP